MVMIFKFMYIFYFNFFFCTSPSLFTNAVQFSQQDDALFLRIVPCYKIKNFNLFT